MIHAKKLSNCLLFLILNLQVLQFLTQPIFWAIIQREEDLNFILKMVMAILGLECSYQQIRLIQQICFSLFSEKKGELWYLLPDNDPLKPSAYRIPYMERLGQNKILKGTISVTFLYLFYSPIRYNQI